MRFTTLLRLAVAGGHSDGLRITLTGIGAVLGTLALLVVATVLSISGEASYGIPLLDQPGLRPGVTVTLLLLCVPVMFFVAQCARVGAPARDRRLAAIRMAGATPRQAVLLAAVETGLSTALGALLGVGCYLAGRALLDNPGSTRDTLPTDVLPPGWVFVLILIGLPLLGTWLAAVSLRRVLFTPFGVVRRERTRPPRVLPAVLFVVGVGGLILFAPLLVWIERSQSLPLWFFFVPMLVFTVFTALGLVLGTAALSAALGRMIAGRARRPAVLIAARRLAADPWASGRSLAALLVTVFFGGGVLGVRATFLGERDLQAEASRREALAVGMPASAPDPFYAQTFDLIQLAVWVAIVIAAAGLLVAALDQFLERRRTLAALVAQGTPRGVLARAAMLQVLLPLLPGVALGSAAGMLGARGVYGDTAHATTGGSCSRPAGAPENWCLDPSHSTPLVELVRTVPVPYADLALLSAGAVLVTLAVTAVSLLLLRQSTDITELRAAA
jgi:hypothetical protein